MAKTKSQLVSTTNKHQSALETQYNRTGFINNIAAQVNIIITKYADAFKPGEFYARVQSCFRKEPLNNRFLLLRQLKGMEIDPKFPLARLGEQNIEVEVVKKEFVVTISVNGHPDEGRQKANCYFYDVIFAIWDKNNKSAQHSRQVSGWVDMNDGYPDFEFAFSCPASAVHWMLCVRKRLGSDEEIILAQRNEGMQIMEVGSLDRKDYALLKKREKEKLKKNANNAVAPLEVIRVAAKRIRKPF